MQSNNNKALKKLLTMSKGLVILNAIFSKGEETENLAKYSYWKGKKKKPHED